MVLVWLGLLVAGIPGDAAERVLQAWEAPGGGARVERRIEAERGGRTWVVDARGVEVDLGGDFFPAGWSEDGRRVRGYRLLEDGHELLAALPEARERTGERVAWGGGPGGFEPMFAALVSATAARARALRRERLVSGQPAHPGGSGNQVEPSGCPGWIVCVDAGHGGPGAAQWNGVNGDGAGAHGPGGLTEQWVNLRVSELLMARLATDPRFAGSFRTRTAETQAVSLADRVLMAAAGAADLFLSVHHNGLPAGTPNRTETYYCRANPLCIDESTWRLPAQRAHDRIVAAFGYVPRGALEDSIGSGRFHFYVLRNSASASVLTEASNLNGDAHEEDLFGRDPEERHARAEALALHQALIEQFGYPTGVDEGDAEPPIDRFDRLEARLSADGAMVEIDWALARPGQLEFLLFDVSGRRLGPIVVARAPGAGRLALPVGRAPLPSGIYWLLARESGTSIARRRLIHTR